MNSPLYAHLFTAEEKLILSSLLSDISQKNKNGLPYKISFFKHLEVLLDFSILSKNDDYIILERFGKSIAIDTISNWHEDKQTLFKGLVIDLLCHNETLIKEECEAAQKLFVDAGIDDIELNRIVQSRLFNT
jgi:hypothetical protein